VSRYDNEKLVRAYFTVKIGEKIGDVQNLDGKDVDLSTKHTLVSLGEGDETIWFGTDHLRRPTRLATLRPEGRGPTFTLMLENDQYIPLLK
jgi:hypothetical protein